MKVLVTGATSLLGRTVAQILIERGDDLTVFQRRSAGLECREVRGDIVDDEAVAAAVAGHEAIVHLAARVSPTGSKQLFDRVNVYGSANVVAAARKAGASRLVYVSSPAVAHTSDAQAGVSAAPPDPTRAPNNYARSKAEAERLVLRADRAALAVVAIRPHLVWGPGDTQLVERVVERARSGRLRLVGHGAALVDTTYVDNAAEAIVAAIDHAEAARGQALVVSNGEPRTAVELLRNICEAASVEVPTGRVPLPIAKMLGSVAERAWSGLQLQSDPPMTRFLAEQLGTAHWYDQRTTRQLLQWEPSVSLRRGFERLASYYDSIS